jgi:hypothetical protein
MFRPPLCASLFGICITAGLSVAAKPKFVQAHFYEFIPTKCHVSLTGLGSAKCESGALSVAAQDRGSVNIHLMSKLGQWQFILSNGETFAPDISYVIIRSNANISNQSPAPDFYYSSQNGDILEGVCTPIPITQKTSGRCVARFKDGRRLDISFSTDALGRMLNVQQRL